MTFFLLFLIFRVSLQIPRNRSRTGRREDESCSSCGESWMCDYDSTGCSSCGWTYDSGTNYCYRNADCMSCTSMYSCSQCGWIYNENEATGTKKYPSESSMCVVEDESCSTCRQSWMCDSDSSGCSSCGWDYKYSEGICFNSLSCYECTSTASCSNDWSGCEECGWVYNENESDGLAKDLDYEQMCYKSSGGSGGGSYVTLIVVGIIALVAIAIVIAVVYSIIKRRMRGGGGYVAGGGSGVVYSGGKYGRGIGRSTTRRRAGVGLINVFSTKSRAVPVHPVSNIQQNQQQMVNQNDMSQQMSIVGYRKYLNNQTTQVALRWVKDVNSGFFTLEFIDQNNMILSQAEVTSLTSSFNNNRNNLEGHVKVMNDMYKNRGLLLSLGGVGQGNNIIIQQQQQQQQQQMMMMQQQQQPSGVSGYSNNNPNVKFQPSAPLPSNNNVMGYPNNNNFQQPQVHQVQQQPSSVLPYMQQPNAHMTSRGGGVNPMAPPPPGGMIPMHQQQMPLEMQQNVVGGGFAAPVYQPPEF